jgi:riboflavin synthase
MFTGIVEETGEVLAVEENDEGRRLRVGTTFELREGQSVSVSGACLTVEEHGDGWFSLFLAEETLDRTYLGALEAGDAVNLERALPADGRLDGHFVQGHVDATGEVLAVERVGEDWQYTFSLPESQGRYVVEKGSIAVDGISLTVADRDVETFRVAIIPETYELTTLSEKAVGDPVHLEVDVIAKYVESLVETRAVEGIVRGVEE